MSYAIKLNSTDQILTFRAYTQDSTSGQYVIPETGLNSSTDGLSLEVKRIGETAVSIASLTDKVADNTTHADGAIRWLGGNHYSVDVPDSSFATQVPSVMIGGVYTSGLIEGDMHPIVGYDATLDAVGAADAVWDEAYASHTSAGTFGKLMDILRKSNLTIDGVVDGVPDSGSFDSNITHADGTFDHQTIIFTDGSLEGELRPILTQIGGLFTFEEPFTSVPASGDNFSILPEHVHPISEVQSGLATAEELAKLSVGSAGISVVATSFQKTGAEPETNSYTDTSQLNGTYHIVEDDGGSTDFYYQFSIGPNGVPSSVEWAGYAQSNGDSYNVYFYNWALASWDQVGSITGFNTTSETNEQFSATIAHVGTGANVGIVRFRVESPTGTAFATNRLLCTYAVISESLGYESGRVWVDEDNGTSTGTDPGTDGLITNRSTVLNNAVTIATSLGYHDINITNGNSVTISNDINNFYIYGNQANAVLNSVNLGGTEFFDFDFITGTGVSGGRKIKFSNCDLGQVSLSPYTLKDCGIEGSVVATSGGEFVIKDCYSEVPGSNKPIYNYANVTESSSINIRNYNGGGDWRFNEFCTASIEVAVGGSQDITANSGEIEFRGFCKSISAVLTSSAQLDIIAFTGPITVSGDSGTINVYGQHSSITDNSGGSVSINDYSVDGPAVGTNIESIITSLGVINQGVQKASKLIPHGENI